MKSIVNTLFALGLLATPLFAQDHVGPQKDGTFIVSTAAQIAGGAIAFDGRPIDLAIHPTEDLVAVLNQKSVILVKRDGVVTGAVSQSKEGAAFRGIAWTPDGKTILASFSDGVVRKIAYENGTIALAGTITTRASEQAPNNPRPGGLCVTSDGKTAFIATLEQNSVIEVDIASGNIVHNFPVQMLPFEAKLSDDEQTIVVSNWAGRPPEAGDDTGETGDAVVVVDPRGVSAKGSVSLVDRKSGNITHIEVGHHPTCMAVAGDTLYVANSADDSISVLSIKDAKVTSTIPIKWKDMNLFGSMPSAMAVTPDRLYVCNGGDNAVCEIDRTTQKVLGFRPAGYYPTGIQLSHDGKTAYVVNTKGNGSVRNTLQGLKGNAHDFQGTVSVIDLTSDLESATDTVVQLNRWDQPREPLNPDLKVYRGAIRHVLYIIKENRTYDEILGDMPQGNGKKELNSFGANVTPNHHALADEFTLFDNFFVTGTNSADGHHWTVEALANDYMERFYAGYRTYPDSMQCVMGNSAAGNLWDLANASGKSHFSWGEGTDYDESTVKPRPKNWAESWKARQKGEKPYKFDVVSDLPAMKGRFSKEYLWWPLIFSDQDRCEIFLRDFDKMVKDSQVPDLMILSLPADHTSGRSQFYPTPRAMIADNDLALGRIIEAVTHSPIWKETAILVIEDDAQAGPDHVDGHRTVALAISPYTRRKNVDSTLYTTLSMVKSLELMLGLKPMNKFDTLALPLSNCFTDTPDVTPYVCRKNIVALDEMNPTAQTMTEQDQFLAEVSEKLDFSEPDSANWWWLNRIVWHSAHGMNVAYPERPDAQQIPAGLESNATLGQSYIDRYYRLFPRMK